MYRIVPTCLFSLCLLIMLPLRSLAQSDTIKVMAWNILHGANDIPNGRYHAIEIIEALDPDINPVHELFFKVPVKINVQC